MISKQEVVLGKSHASYSSSSSDGFQMPAGTTNKLFSAGILENKFIEQIDSMQQSPSKTV